MKRLMIAILLASTSVMAIDRFDIKPDNCQNWLGQAMYNNKKIYAKDTTRHQDTAQYETGMLAFMSYQACVNREQSIRLNKKLEIMVKELQAIKSQLIQKQEDASEAPQYSSKPDSGIPPAFDYSMGDYQ